MSNLKSLPYGKFMLDLVSLNLNQELWRANTMANYIPWRSVTKRSIQMIYECSLFHC